MSTHDATEGQLRLGDALKRVEGNADEAWYKAALAAVQRVATNNTTFTTDEVWLVLERTLKVGGPREPRAMGAVMRQAVRNAWCTTTAMTIKSTRAECHRRPVRVYESRLYPS